MRRSLKVASILLSFGLFAGSICTPSLLVRAENGSVDRFLTVESVDGEDSRKDIIKDTIKREGSTLITEDIDNTPSVSPVEKTIAQSFPDPIMAQGVANAVSMGDVDAIITQQIIEDTRFLGISFMGVTDITGISIFENLEQLTLTGNDLVTLPDELGDLVKLNLLGISYNELIELPDTIGNLVNLELLDADYNQIESLPDSIGNLTSLRHLILDFNQLRVLPDTIGDMVSLTALSLHDNQLTVLPDSIGDLIKLTHLWLSENQLQVLPESMGNLTNLGELWLYKNQLRTLPDSIVNLIYLENFQFRYNALTNLTQEQYDFMLGLNAGILLMYDQSFSTKLDKKGMLNSMYGIEAYEAYEQFPNYEVTFTYELMMPSGISAFFEPVFVDGKLQIAGNLLSEYGAYTLVTRGTGGLLEPVTYTYEFIVDEKPDIVTGTDGEDEDFSTENSTIKIKPVTSLPKTGNSLTFAGWIMTLGGGCFLMLRRLNMGKLKNR